MAETFRLIGALIALAGILAMLPGLIGFVTLPDPLRRLHGAALALGAGLSLAAFGAVVMTLFTPAFGGALLAGGVLGAAGPAFIYLAGVHARARGHSPDLPSPARPGVPLRPKSSGNPDGGQGEN